MGSTTPYGLRYPERGVGANGPLAFQQLAEDIAPKLYRAEPLTAAQIMAIASPRIGQLVFNTDTGRSQEWNGTQWRSIGTGASGSTLLPGAVTYAGAPTVSTFVGKGFTEVSFAIANDGRNGGISATVNTDAATAFGQSVTNTGLLPFAVSSASASVDVNLLLATNQLGNFQVSNMRLDSDGYLRLAFVGGLTALSASTRLTWRAR